MQQHAELAHCPVLKVLQPNFLRFQGLGSDFLVDAIGKFIDVAIAVQVYDLLPRL